MFLKLNICILLFQFLKKLHRLERVVEEVKHVLKPHYNKKRITKEEYKDVMRKSVPKVKKNSINYGTNYIDYFFGFRYVTINPGK